MCETRIIEHTDIKYLLDKGKRKNSYIQIKNGQVIYSKIHRRFAKREVRVDRKKAWTKWESGAQARI